MGSSLSTRRKLFGIYAEHFTRNGDKIRKQKYNGEFQSAKILWNDMRKLEENSVHEIKSRDTNDANAYAICKYCPRTFKKIQELYENGHIVIRYKISSFYSVSLPLTEEVLDSFREDVRTNLHFIFYVPEIIMREITGSYRNEVDIFIRRKYRRLGEHALTIE